MVLERWAELTSDERSGAFLAALRERLQRQSQVPPLPAGWATESALVPAEGFEYGGDFFIADVRDGALQMVLVDACGHGPTAVPDAVQFAGALGALVLTLPHDDVMPAANQYVLRRGHPYGFTTAAQVVVDLVTREYRILSAGHPPVLRWSRADEEWVIDGARGTALGVTAEPSMSVGMGRLLPGEALLFYTDGVVEARGHDIDEGIEHLRHAAGQEVARGFPGLPGRLLAGLPRGEDDRAIMVLRSDVPSDSGPPRTHP